MNDLKGKQNKLIHFNCFFKKTLNSYKIFSHITVQGHTTGTTDSLGFLTIESRFPGEFQNPDQLRGMAVPGLSVWVNVVKGEGFVGYEIIRNNKQETCQKQ